MNFFKSFILVLVFLSSSSFAGGGVDVGNGSKSMSYYTNDYESEKELVSALLKLKNDVLNLKDNLVAQLQKDAKCKSKIKISNIESINKYAIKNKSIIFI